MKQFSDVMEDVDSEIIRQYNRWGTQVDISNDRWFTIMMEELGEAARAYLHESTNAPIEMSSYQELVQLTAILYRALQVWECSK